MLLVGGSTIRKDFVLVDYNRTKNELMSSRKPKAAPAVNKGGKPRYVPTPQDRQLVEAYFGVGMTQEEICGAMSRPAGHERGPLRMSVPTLRKVLRPRGMESARVRTVARMRIKLIAKADAGDVAALLHVNRVFGWNERLTIELPLPRSEEDLKTLTDQELHDRAAKLRRHPAVLRAV